MVDSEANEYEDGYFNIDPTGYDDGDNNHGGNGNEKSLMGIPINNGLETRRNQQP